MTKQGLEFPAGEKSVSSMDSRQIDLTICTNIIPLDRKNIELNWDIVTRLNAANGWKWIVTVDNNETEGHAIEPVTQLGDSRCELVEVYDEEIRQASLWGANYHHGVALNKILHKINSRFVLFIDPDFYIVRKGWIPEILTYMQQQKLAFWGVPWHPKWYMKYRYFPCVHCLFIDLDQIPLKGLNLMPDTLEQTTIIDSPWRRIKAKMRPHLPRFVRAPMQLMWWTVLNRKKICKEWDTGSRIYLEYCKSELRSECAIPVFRPAQDFLGPRQPFFAFNKILESMLPDQYSYIPKQKGYFTTKGFQESGYPDVTQMAWEEFMWQNEPLGFHVRRYPKRKDNLADHDALLPDILEQFIQKANRGVKS